MKHLATLLILGAATLCNAQDNNKMSRYIRQLVTDWQEVAQAKCFTGNNVKKNAAADFVIAFAKGDDTLLRQYSIRRAGDIHIVRLPIDKIAELSEDHRIERIEASPARHKAMLDNSAAAISANEAWTGNSLPQAYDGAGVVVGNIDVGQDYTHPTFRSTKDGRLRIVRAWDIIDIPEGQTLAENSPFPFGTFLNDTTDILRKQHSADYATEYHGTHTASTASGSGWGTQYRGIAPESDIYMLTTTWGDNYKRLPEEFQEYATTAFNALQFSNIFDYADSVGKPCVINYSGSGLQDMTDEEALLEAYMEQIVGPGRIIMAAAGNNGITGHRHLPYITTGKTVGGKICTNEDIFTINISTRRKLTLRITNATAPDDPTQSLTIPLDMTPNDKDGISGSGLRMYDFTDLTRDELLDSMTVTVYTGFNGFDGTKIGYDIFLGDGRRCLKDGTYILEIEGMDEESDAFVQQGEVLPTELGGGTLDGALDEGSLGSPASLPGVIAVGATVRRATVTTLSGAVMGNRFGNNGEPANFSSHGPSLHGLMKPEVSAPGVYVNAAMNSFYNNPDDNVAYKHVAESHFGSRTYHWLTECGTSMACPVATGTVALWLQADPTLTPDRVREIISRTSTHPDPALAYPNYLFGHGEINAYKGLLEILNYTSISGLDTRHADGVAITPAPGGNISVTFTTPPPHPVALRLYTTDGALAGQATLAPQQTTHTVPLHGARGVVAVQVDGYGSTLIRVQ